MEADSLFLKGHSHTYCEDYAAHWLQPGLGIALVADGCSSSEKTDVGARLVAEAARATICELYGPTHLEGNLPENATQRLLQSLSRRLIGLQALVGLPEEALDATLLVAIATAKTNEIRILMFGDGYVVWKKRDGTRIEIASHYPSGAPFYLNYLIHPQREVSYKNLFGEPKTVAKKLTIPPEGEPTEEILPEIPHHSFTLPLNEIEWVALFSDGVDTFSNLEEAQLPVGEILKELTAYKTLPGEFVKRRLIRFQKECGKQKKSHSDDLCSAALAFPDVPPPLPEPTL